MSGEAAGEFVGTIAGFAETIFSARIHPAMRNLTGEAAM
jgi:hypothetical protein